MNTKLPWYEVVYQFVSCEMTDCCLLLAREERTVLCGALV